MKTIIYTKLDKKLENEWTTLWDNSPFANYLNSPHWFISAVKNFGYQTYVIVAFYNDEYLIGVAGLIKEKRYGAPVYTLSPADFVCGNPFLMDLQDKEIVTALSSELNKLGTVFLDNVPEQLTNSLQAQNKENATIPYSLNFYVDSSLDNEGRVFIENRANLMRKVKKIEDKFTIQTFFGDSKEAINIAFKIDKKSRKHSRGYNAFSYKEVRSFYAALSRNFKMNFCTNILYYDKTPIVYEMGFRVGETYYGSQIAFDNRFSRYAPGKVFAVKLIESLAQQGIKQIDLGSGDNSLKRELTPTYRQLYKMVISKNIFVRLYLTLLYQGKEQTFEMLQKHARIYTVYRNTRKALGLSL